MERGMEDGHPNLRQGCAPGQKKQHACCQ